MALFSTSMSFPTAVLVVNSVGLVLSFIAVGLRFHVRFSRRVKWRLCDYTILASWIFTLGLVISENFCVTRGGVGQKIELVGLDQLVFASKQFLVIGVTGTLAVTLVKVSILDFLLSIFETHQRFRITAYALMAVTVGYGISFTIVTLAGCQPFQANWDKVSHPNYTCINTSYFYVAQGAIGAFLDIAVLLLPVPVVWGLALKTSKKIALTFLFTIGILICGISLTRLAYNTNETYLVTRFTEYAGIAAILGALEANLSIICACLPILPSLLSSIAEKVRVSLNSNQGGLRRLLNSLSLRNIRSRPTTHDAIKLESSSANNLREGFASNGDDQDLESARIQNQQDKLYPLSVSGKTQISLDDRDAQWVGTVTANRSGVDAANVWRDENSMELAQSGGREEVEPFSNINVTKSWLVNRSP